MVAAGHDGAYRCRMARPLSLVAALSLFALSLHVGMGCSKDEEPECSKDSQCTSATTGCTYGACKDGKCVAQPLADGTRAPDQSPVKDKWCVTLKCKAGVPNEFPDGSKTPAPIECKQQTCNGTTLEVTDIRDGVGCGGGGACRGGVCQPPIDSGTSTDTGATDTGSDDTGSSDDSGGTDASSD